MKGTLFLNLVPAACPLDCGIAEHRIQRSAPRPLVGTSVSCCSWLGIDVVSIWYTLVVQVIDHDECSVPELSAHCLPVGLWPHQALYSTFLTTLTRGPKRFVLSASDLVITISCTQVD